METVREAFDSLPGLVGPEAQVKKVMASMARSYGGDPAKAAARVPRWERAGFLEFTRTLGPGAIPVDVWVDGQNLVRRVSLSLRLPGGKRDIVEHAKTHSPICRSVVSGRPPSSSSAWRRRPTTDSSPTAQR